MSFELALKEIEPTFTTDDGIEVQIRPLEAGDEKALLGFFKNLPEPEVMFFKRRVRDPEVIKQWCENIDLYARLPLLALHEGKVIAVGSGARDETGKVQPLDVKEGNAILFGKWSGTEVKIDGQDYLIMKESDIMGIID